jgi:hypothetical protein
MFVAYDFFGNFVKRVCSYFVDHNTKTTSWTDPRISAAKQRQKENKEAHAKRQAEVGKKPRFSIF